MKIVHLSSVKHLIHWHSDQKSFSQLNLFVSTEYENMKKIDLKWKENEIQFISQNNKKSECHENYKLIEANWGGRTNNNEKFINMSSENIEAFFPPLHILWYREKKSKTHKATMK